MNNQRRKQINQLIESLEELKGQAEAIQEEEQEYIDNVPENLQDSERAEAANEAVSQLEYSVDNLQEAIDNLTESTI